MIQPSDIHTITEFRRNADLSRRIASDGRPHVLTEDGRAKLVVQDAAAYQSLLEAFDQARTLTGIQAGLESMQQAQGRPAQAAFDEVRRKRKIPREP